MAPLFSQRQTHLAVLVALILCGGSSAGEPLRFERSVPREPADARQTFETLPGFEMQLVASEPLVASPVALEYDEFGNGWVLEMHDYPFTDKNTDKPFVDKSADPPLGRIRVLKDTDGDGVFDQSTVFTDGISWPTGLAFWKKGVFVAATPDLWYLKDTDGDGAADLKEKLYTGFRKFNIQAVMNNLRWGLDHQIYGAGGTNGGSIQSLLEPQSPAIPFGSNDFRINPIDRRLAVLSGGARFGHALDDWGNRFLCNIRNPVIHVVLPAHYLARNPYVPVRSSLFDCAETGDTLPVYRSSPAEPWRAFRATRWTTDLEGKLYPKSELVPGGYFTSACGITMYRGAAWPTEYYGQVFLSDVASNVIHRQVLTVEGATFRSRRVDDGTEFVRSTDTWFRPVNFTNAPDGTLHVVDMYRETIEHPWSIPDDIKEALDLLSGRERGRIWRIAPTGFQSELPQPLPGHASTIQLVALLEHSNSWQRDTAARLLFERQDRSAIPLLRNLLTSSQSPVARGLALWGLQGLQALETSDLLIALQDESPRIREQGIVLAEPLLDQAPKTLDQVLERARDDDPRVRFQVALSLGESTDARVTAALAGIARRDSSDEFLRAAILSSAANRCGTLLDLLLADRDFVGSPVARPLFRLLARGIGGRGDSAELAQISRHLLSSGVTPDNRMWKIELVQGLDEGLKRSGAALAGALPETTGIVDELLADARATTAAENVDAGQKEQAVQMLALGRFESVRDHLLNALAPSQPGTVQLAAVRVLSTFTNPELSQLFIEHWPGASPAVRGELIEALLSRPERIPALLDAIAAGKIGATQLAPARRGLLIRHVNPQIKERARALFGADAPSPRTAVVAQYLGALEGAPDRAKGKVVFERECSTCHRQEGKGYAVGPSLETVRHHTPEQILANILDPNREVAPAFVDYAIALRDGRVATGMITSETATSVTLKRPNDVQETILREAIAEMSSTGVSLMPEGLEKKLSPTEMRDLLGWLLQQKVPGPTRK